MNPRILSLRVRLAALLIPLAVAAPIRAQTPPFYPAIAEADPVAALSRYLRMLAANPRDLASLTGAGRAALAVGDANAALGFYARAEEIAPRNGRIKAGLATALVQMEQPRTALKLFDEAVALGVPVGEIASDRGLANDLNGDGRRAQADYTLALRTKEDDETLRRLALSMAISGDRNGALTILDPLLKRRDSGAVRARAFILALTGDQTGASAAARAAMPPQQASVMASFMGRLSRLNPAQKALAVNFGYFPSDGRSYSAAELFADSRGAPPAGGTAITARDPRRDLRGDTPLIPAGAALGPRLITSASDLAAVAPRRRPGQIEATKEVEPPRHVLTAPIPGQQYASAVSPAAPASVPLARVATAPVASAPSVPVFAASASAGSPAAQGQVLARASVAAEGRVSSPVVAPGFSGLSTVPPTRASPIASATGVAAVPPVTVSPPVVSAGGPASLIAIDAVDLPPSLATPARTGVPMAVAQPRIASATPVIRPPVARIERPAMVAASPTTVKPPVQSASEPVGKAVADKADAKGRPVTVAVIDKPASAKQTAKSKADVAAKAKADAAKTASTDKISATQSTAKTKAAEKARLAEKDKATAAKAAEAAKTAEKTKAAEKTNAVAKAKAKADAAAKAKTPERYWVQVASGANKANLDKAWTNVKGQAPKLLDGKTTYTAPWRASNRLLIGPYKTEAEAQAQVNKLAKAGVSGIQFTTRAGVDVEKVGAK